VHSNARKYMIATSNREELGFHRSNAVEMVKVGGCGVTDHTAVPERQGAGNQAGHPGVGRAGHPHGGGWIDGTEWGMGSVRGSTKGRSCDG
jgi:hypothetical protein